MEQDQSLPWFRAYTKMVDDEKLRLLAFEDRWHFIAILCLKGQGILDSNDPLMMRKAAVKMGLDLRSLEEVARRLAEVGLIEQATLQPIKWGKLQHRSDADPSAAERKRRQRQREREEAEAAKKASEEAQRLAQEAQRQACEQAAHAAQQSAVTGESRVTVTDTSRVTGHDVTRTDIDIDTDTDIQLTEQVVEGEQSSEIAAPAAPPKQSQAPADSPAEPPAPPTPPQAPPKPAKARNGQRLPEDWALPKAWGEWALTQFPAMTADEVRNQADVFADYWRAKAGQDARKLDWLMTWRNWIRRYMETRPVTGTGRAGPPQQQARYSGAAAAIYDGVQL